MKYSLHEIDKVAKELVEKHIDQKIWCFYAAMGMGKTTLIKKICQALGVEEEMSSPTFGIVNEYKSVDDRVIYHFDFYRIKDEAEAEDIGLYEYFDSGSFCFIEWPEKIENLLPEDSMEISINLVDEVTREIMVALND